MTTAAPAPISFKAWLASKVAGVEAWIGGAEQFVEHEAEVAWEDITALTRKVGPSLYAAVKPFAVEVLKQGETDFALLETQLLNLVEARAPALLAQLQALESGAIQVILAVAKSSLAAL